jgi:hypothetical protein
MPRREAEWRIVARPLNDFGDAVYDVYRGGRRLAWGLKDLTAANRWVARLGARDPLDLIYEVPDLSDAATEGRDTDDRELTEAEPYTPRRVWWNEA